MNQVALVNVTGQASSIAAYVDGQQILFAEDASRNTLRDISETAERVANALGVKLIELDYEITGTDVDWCWNEVEVDLINSGRLLPPANDLTLMKGFYRCPSCFNTWTICDTLNEAMSCTACNSKVVEPYYSGDPRATDEDAIGGLADHERRYPDPVEQGKYVVEIARTATRHHVLSIDGAAGPADAHIKAMRVAGDVEFGSESSAEYEVNSVSMRWVQDNNR